MPKLDYNALILALFAVEIIGATWLVQFAAIHF